MMGPKLLAALALLALAAPAARAQACVGVVGGNCATTPCCVTATLTLTCEPVLNQCFPNPRAANQPCVPDDDNYKCGAGLSCDPVFRRCFASPRRAGQPCETRDDCAAPLYCNDYTRRCQAGPTKKNQNCHDPDLPCQGSYTCEASRNECFVYPRVEDTPCTSTADCAAGLACEVGVSQECHPMGVTGKRCHATRPCAPGYSCHPWVQICYDAPRKLNQPCDDDNACGSNLYCDPQMGRCVGPAALGKACGARACAAGLSCHPGFQQCYPVPRLEGMPCSNEADELKCAEYATTGEPLTCDWMATRRCVKPQTFAKTSNVAGAHCYGKAVEDGGEGWSRACQEGLTCATSSDMKCYNSPRLPGQPCGEGEGEECGPGATCRPDTKRCALNGMYGELCYDGYPCRDSFTCTTPNRQCGRVKRVLGETCDPAASPDQCAATSLACSSLWPYCMPPAAVASAAAKGRRLARKL